MVFGLALRAFALSSNTLVSVVASFMLGLCGTYSSIEANTMLQTYSDARMRGRVMGLHGLTVMGVVPLGAMLEGSLGSAVGVPTVLLVGGTLTAAVTSLIAVLADLSRRYSSLVDLHAHFLTGDPSWFTRMIEPSLIGASEVRRAFLAQLSG